MNKHNEMMTTYHTNSYTIGGIEQYLIKRLISHQEWYAKKSLLMDNKTFDLNEQAMFGLMHFLAMTQLKMGHTVFAIHRHVVDDSFSNEFSHLSNWQWQLFSPIMYTINESLNDLVDFKRLFNDIDVAKNDKNAVMNSIYQASAYLKSVFDDYNLSITNQSTNKKTQTLDYGQFYQLLQWLLWFYYYSQYVICQSFDEWVNDIKQHRLFGGITSNKPLIYYEDGHQIFIWLHRSFYAEKQLLIQLSAIHRAYVQSLSVQVDSLLNQEQLRAVDLMSNQALSIITGGPGTGKTFTVAQIVKALLVSGETHLALVAPTGKASQRMKESLQKALGDTPMQLPEPMTIHRLLGIGKSGVPRYHQANPLPHHLIIVDEASMLGVELATWLLSAIKPSTRVILLGDAYQLSAVEAGAVLADLCRLPQLQTLRTQLITSRRFDDVSGVGKLARLIHENQPTTWVAFDALMTQESQLSFYPIQSSKSVGFYDEFVACYQQYFEFTKELRPSFYQMSDQEKMTTIKKLMEVFNQYRVLTASHLSSCGDEAINEYIATQHQTHLNHHKNYLWYHGRPIIITKNRYDLGLYNGDVGICLKSGRHSQELQVYFESHDQIKAFNVNMLEGEVASTVYAMTVHKSQGSEFHHVAICFDENNERLLSKELIYTAVTRAKSQVSMYATPQAVLSAINKPTVRQTGLGVLAKIL